MKTKPRAKSKLPPCPPVDPLAARGVLPDGRLVTVRICPVSRTVVINLRRLDESCPKPFASVVIPPLTFEEKFRTSARPMPSRSVCDSDESRLRRNSRGRHVRICP